MTPKKTLFVLLALATCFQLFFRYDHWSIDRNRVVEYDMLTGHTVVLANGQKRSFIDRLFGRAPRSSEQDRRFNLDNEASAASPSAEENVAMLQVPDNSTDTAAASEREPVSTPRSLPRLVPVNTADTGELPRRSAFKQNIASAAPPAAAPVKKVKQSRWLPPFKKEVTAPTPDQGQPSAIASTEVESRHPSPVLPPVNRPLPKTAQNDINRDGANENIIQGLPNREGVMDFSVVSQGKEVFFGRGHQLRVLTTRHKGWADLALMRPGDQVDVFHYDAGSGSYENVTKNSTQE